jgi:hypothetical protein
LLVWSAGIKQKGAQSRNHERKQDDAKVQPHIQCDWNGARDAEPGKQIHVGVGHQQAQCPSHDRLTRLSVNKLADQAPSARTTARRTAISRE